MKRFEYWLDSQSDSTLKKYYWIFWTVSAISTIFGYVGLIPMKMSVALGIITFFISYIALNGLYNKRYQPKNHKENHIPLIYIISTFILIIAVTYEPITNYLNMQ